MIPSKEYDAKMERNEQMKIKRANIYTLLIIAFCAIVLLCGCSRVVVINGLRMKDDGVIDTAIGDFSYEGKKVIIEYAGGDTKEVDLTEDMIPETERLKFFKMGEQEVKVVYGERYVTKMKINVARHVFDDIYELNGYTCVYDGQPHRVELNRDLPEGATVDYVYGNTFTNAGTYNVVAVLSKEGYASKTLSTQLIIQKANHDTSELTFDDKNVVYNGEVKTIEAENVPEGVTVRYDVYENDIRISNAANAGVYTVVAHFENASSNYNRIADKRATLVIGKADYDMSKVVLSDVTRTYDGQNYTPSLGVTSELPSGVTVSFKCLDKDGNVVLTNANAGDYTIVASYAGNTLNYNAIPDMTAKLVVQKRVVALGDDVTFDDQTVNFDNNAHSLAIAGSLPTGVSVEYENNSQTYAGEYEVVARFVASNPNERVDVEELSAYLIINPIIDIAKIDGHNITYKDFYYDEENYEMNLVGLDTDTYGISSFAFFLADESQETKIEWGDPADALVDGETYRFSINLYYLGEGLDRSILVQPVSDFYTYRSITFEDKTVTYDGTAKTIAATHVPECVAVTYDIFKDEVKVDEAVNVGAYRAVAHFTVGGHTFEKTAVLTIEKWSDRELTGVSLANAEVVYDGQAHSLAIVGVLPEGVTPEYSYSIGGVAAESVVNAGTYDVVARFSSTDPNFDIVTELHATLNIARRVIEITGVTFSDKEVTYNGEAHSLAIEGVLPAGVSVSYDGNGKTYWGEYPVTARFAATDSTNEEVDVTEMNATLTINKMVFTGEDAVFESASLDFDRTEHSLAVQNLPAGVDVEYTNNDKLYAGVYTVTAHFVAENDSVVIEAEDKQATLTINKISEDIFIDGHRISSQDFLYDVDKVALNIEGFDPELYDYERITFSWPISSYGSNWLWFYYNSVSPTDSNKLTGKNYSGQEIHYVITFQYHDADLRSSVELNTMTGYCVYDASDNTFTECVSTDDSES